MTQTIEQLTARVRELEEDKRIAELIAELEHIREQKNLLWFEFSIATQQLAAEQLNNKRLRDALIATRNDLELRMRLTEDDSLNISNSVLDQMLDAIDITASTEALDAYVAEKVKESHKVIPREGLVPHAYQLEATHNNAEYWYKWGHSKEAAKKGESVICMAQAVFAWRNAAYAKAEEVATLTKQRDLAVEALTKCSEQLTRLGYSANHADKALSAIKESEGKG